LVVLLALVDTNTTDQTSHEDGLHYVSVVCPIRSPVVVIPATISPNSLELNKLANPTEIEGIVYCQTSNISDINSTKSINEQLLDANLATLDKKNCINQTSVFSFLSRIYDC
jgi:hypothetical protein